MSVLLYSEEQEGKKFVLCYNCWFEIGWLGNAQIAQAIELTRGRGGVLCPECRSKICKVCSFFHETERELENCRWLRLSEEEPGEDRVCLSSLTYLHKTWKAEEREQ